MKRFVSQANVAHFRKLLASEGSEANRALLLQLLAEAERKAAESDDDEPDAPPPHGRDRRFP